MAVMLIEWASLVVQLVKNPPAMKENPVQFLGLEVPWRREQLPTLVFWPEEFHGLYSPWGGKESDMTERVSHFHFHADSIRPEWPFSSICQIVSFQTILFVFEKFELKGDKST